MPAAPRDAAARNPQAARQDSRDAAWRAPRGGNPRSRAGSTGGHADHRTQRFAAVTDNDNGPQADVQPPEVIGVRHGMFGATGSGDTSGYGRLVRPVELPGSSPRPYGGYFDDVVDKLAAALGEDGYAASIERVVVFRDELTLEVQREQLPAVAQVLRDDPGLRFELCLGV